MNQIAEMDDEEEDEDWEFEKLRRINPDYYIAILSKARLNLQYFQFKDNPHFISPRFLPAIQQLIKNEWGTCYQWPYREKWFQYSYIIIIGPTENSG